VVAKILHDGLEKEEEMEEDEGKTPSANSFSGHLSANIHPLRK